MSHITDREQLSGQAHPTVGFEPRTRPLRVQHPNSCAIGTPYATITIDVIVPYYSRPAAGYDVVLNVHYLFRATSSRDEALPGERKWHVAKTTTLDDDNNNNNNNNDHDDYDNNTNNHSDNNQCNINNNMHKSNNIKRKDNNNNTKVLDLKKRRHQIFLIFVPLSIYILRCVILYMSVRFFPNIGLSVLLSD